MGSKTCNKTYVIISRCCPIAGSCRPAAGDDGEKQNSVKRMLSSTSSDYGVTFGLLRKFIETAFELLVSTTHPAVPRIFPSFFHLCFFIIPFKMSKLPPIPSWIPGSDLLHPTFRYTTPAIPSTVDELHKLFEPKTSLYAFVAMTAFNPIFWNFVARNGVYMSLIAGCIALCQTVDGGMEFSCTIRNEIRY